MGKADRSIRLTGGVALITLFFVGVFSKIIGIVSIIFAGILVLTGLSGVYPLYWPFKIKTKEKWNIFYHIKDLNIFIYCIVKLKKFDMKQNFTLKKLRNIGNLFFTLVLTTISFLTVAQTKHIVQVTNNKFTPDE